MARQILGGSERESWLDHHAAWLSRPEADRLLAELLAGLPWEQRDIVLFGRRIAQPRLVAWASERPYRYSGQTLPPRALPPPLTEILARVNEATGCGFNHILANRYRDGRDSMGMHADDEPELG
ncbi:MAG: alpha-ketoglutarate-dependent dioxygenase AlkB, partial [Myxococcales bacterium]|nr:alpha-ketoglutarate-dependent dioxygenase AlkB [Myxococcales bacterium]